MNENKDRDLRTRFSDMRRQDENSAPSFAAVIRKSNAAPAKPNIQRSHGSLLLFGACAAVFAVAAVWSSNRASSAPWPQDIAEWRPRSDALLDGARRSLLITMPPLTASVLDPILH